MRGREKRNATREKGKAKRRVAQQAEKAIALNCDETHCSLFTLYSLRVFAQVEQTPDFLFVPA